MAGGEKQAAPNSFQEEKVSERVPGDQPDESPALPDLKKGETGKKA